MAVVTSPFLLKMPSKGSRMATLISRLSETLPRLRSRTLADFPLDIDLFSKCDHSPQRYTAFNHPESNP